MKTLLENWPLVVVTLAQTLLAIDRWVHRREDNDRDLARKVKTQGDEIQILRKRSHMQAQELTKLPVTLSVHFTARETSEDRYRHVTAVLAEYRLELNQLRSSRDRD